MPLAELTGGDHALLEAVREVIRRNYDAAERLHTVGAAVRCGSGRVYTGVNVYALHGACAEQVALGCAIAHGERTFEAIAAVRGPAGEEVIPPCGNCRQLLCDYAPRCGVILCVDGALKRVPAQELLPYPYRTGD